MTMVYLLVAMMSYTAFCQNPVYSTIAKNIHPDGRSLHHDLNAAGDTLHLKSDYKLYKVEFISEGDSKEFMIEGNKSEAYIPLASVPVGEYTIAGFQIERSDDIYQYQKTIIFRVFRLLPIPTDSPFEEEDVIAESFPEINKDVPIIEKVAKVEVVVVKPEPPKKKKVKTQPKPRVVKRVKRPKKETRVAATINAGSKTFEESVKKAREKKVVRKNQKKNLELLKQKSLKWTLQIINHITFLLKEEVNMLFNPAQNIDV